MSSIAVHFVLGEFAAPFNFFWLGLSVGGTVVLALLIILLIRLTKKRKGRKIPLKPEKIPASQNADIQQILKTLQGSNGQILLAGSGLADLPVTIPVNLAVSLAETGKCLLIDFDTKRNALAKVFEVDSSKIRSDLMTSPIPTEFKNLSIWPAQYFHLLKQTNLRSLLDKANSEYEHILLYAPYLTVLADRNQIAYFSKQAIVFCKDSKRVSQLHHLLKIGDCKILLDA